MSQNMPNAFLERLRRCISCRSLRPRKESIRITYSRTLDCVSINNDHQLQGRSVYICRNQECLAQAIKRKSIPKLLKHAVSGDIVLELSKILEGLQANAGR